MLSPLRNRFGIPGVISVIALVFAMFGGAYAATNEGGKATSSAKAKKGPRGPKGAKGDTGPAGPAGPAGAKGDTGAAGSSGANGKDGTSVTNASEPKGANCKEGGTKLVGSSTTYACNGEKGPNGAPGSPWTVDGTLPPGKTETGTWAFGQLFEVGPSELDVPISFNIPLVDPLTSAGVHYIAPGGGATTECPGSVGDPKAEPGHLCVYGGVVENATIVGGSIIDPATTSPGASTAGAVIQAILPEAGAKGFGTWAVSAE